MINNGSHLILYSHNRNVRGEERSVIYNFKKGTLSFIPNSLSELLDELTDKPVATVRAELEGEDRETFDEYVSYLRTNQLAFYTNEPYAFPEMPGEYFTPEHITYCVLEFNPNEDYGHFGQQLNEMLCKNLEIRVPGGREQLTVLKVLLEHLACTTLRSIAIYLDADESLQLSALQELFHQFPKLDNITVLGYKEEIPTGHQEDITFFKASAESVYAKPFPLDKYLVNRKYFLLSSNHHPYFYKRMEVDFNGEVKNCLLHQQSFGNIFQQNLSEIIRSEDFRKWWDVSNDQIEDFKGNELRFALFTQHPLKLTSKGTYQLEAF